jgi:endonuclease I
MRKYLLLSIASFCVATTFATEPSGYYSSCENLSGANLLTALYNTVSAHTTVSYSGLWTLYQKTDVHPNGKIWDMYSTKEWTYKSEQCGSYKNVGDCYNREHSFPKSWFNDDSPMVSDAFHIYPTDGKVNGQRSNYPYGECANGTTLSSYNGIDALGKLGTCTFSGYTGTVFEPDDQYKGDFARSYFYMAAAYNDRISGWTSKMLNNTSYPAFDTWAINLLLKWHRQDPVSEKEINRNEAVYAAQKNRNPFIDHPELVEYIWGDKQNEKWTSNISAEPILSLPVNNSTIDLGYVGVGVSRKTTINVKGSNLTSNVTVSVSGTGLSVSPTTLSASSVNAADGTSVTLTYVAPSAGSATGTLTFKSGSITSTVNITATALDGIPASEPTNISSDSFVAHWTYVGSADANGCYRLYLTDADNNVVDTYPRSVVATDERALVDELEPSTTYVYYISNGELNSNRITVTTGAPLASVELYHDGDLVLQSEPGVPSEPEEVLVDAENIDTSINLFVSEPFELSSNKSDWTPALTIDPEEDRFYIRVNSNEAGVFQSGIVIISGDYYNDDAMVTASVGTQEVSFVEDFETDKTTSYSVATCNGDASTWALSDAGIYESSSESYHGKNYLRFGKTSASSAEMSQDKTSGIGTVSFYASGWSSGDGDATLLLQYSTDQGATWLDAGEVEIVAPSSTAKQYNQYSVAVNKTGNARIRLQQKEGKRVCIDYITISNYTQPSSGLEGVESDYRAWDAYCLNSQLCIELSRAQNVAVYGMDGNTYHSGVLPAGTTTLNLAKGLYVIVVEDFSRRVLVK